MTLTAECSHCGQPNEFEVDDELFKESTIGNPFTIEIECGYNDCHETFYVTGQVTDSLAGE